ncbi:protein kinase C iota type-like isoform X1 [Pocillopora verrucosa]|uniref:protein kinase C iota type-like isoform X1 n=1 Tax=Pocillopora verrucosa TaxID=203993 RepID=UPI00334108F4
MTEISLNCLPVGMTSVGKNVYPVVNTLDESDDKGNDVTTENFEGVDPCVLTGYREMDGSTNEQEEVEDLEASAQDFNLVHEELGFQDELGFLYLPINLRAIFDGTIMVLSMENRITLEKFCDEMRDIFRFGEEDEFTMKWLDEEGDPCTISTQVELDEAIRLYELNRDSELVVHLFKGIPDEPGRLCDGETRNIYRRGAKRWRKIHRVNGHSFVAKRFSRLAACSFCSDRIWGLGRQGYKCLECKLVVHKKCHKLIKIQCGQQPHPSSQTIHSSLPPIGAVGTKLPPAEEAPGPKRTRSDSPATRKRGLVTVDYSHGSKAKEASSGNNFLISLNDFTLLRVIGRGSYAKVLLVELKKNKRIYAMKVVKKELVNDDEDIDWVQTEKHVFEQASNHPFLVGLHSCFQTASRLFFVIEFVSGGDLMYHMQRQRRLPEDHARFYSAEISCALNFLHERGVIYRDLKLDNVLLDSDGHVKLTDYGMCKEGLRPGDTTSTFCGTPNYIAPEILRGEDYGFSVDWWALGVLMFEMLAGRSPFDVVGSAENPDQNTEDYLFQVILEKPIRIPRSLSVKAASILKGFLNKNPIERLGCHPQTGFADITSHVFFRTVDWEQLEARQVAPPFKPMIEDQYGLENFDPQFTNEPVQLTPDDPKMLETIDQSEFEGFEYINPLLMSSEECV